MLKFSVALLSTFKHFAW